MIIVKSVREIALMREAGAIVAATLEAVHQAIKPGITTKELDTIAEQVITLKGAIPSFKGYGGFPSSICTSVNEVLIHGIPGKYRLKKGDIISIDVGARYKGYHGDAARTFIVDSTTEVAQKLVEVTKESFYQAVKLIRPGIHLGDVSHAIQAYVESFGYGVPRDYTGHGIGSDLHEDPAIPNYGLSGTGPLLKAGMCLAIEPMVTLGHYQTRVGADNWTVRTVDGKWSAHYENTIVVTESGYEILTDDLGR